MKRYERMSKEDIIKAYDSIHLGCEKCQARGIEFCGNVDCVCAIEKWLSEEIVIKKVPRFQAIKTVEEMKAEGKKLIEFCHGRRCGECRIHKDAIITGNNCFALWLCEEIEVEE